MQENNIKPLNLEYILAYARCIQEYRERNKLEWKLVGRAVNYLLNEYNKPIENIQYCYTKVEREQCLRQAFDAYYYKSKNDYLQYLETLMQECNRICSDENTTVQNRYDSEEMLLLCTHLKNLYQVTTRINHRKGYNPEIRVVDLRRY